MLPWQPRRGQNGAARVNPSVAARHGHTRGLWRHRIQDDCVLAKRARDVTHALAAEATTLPN